MSIQSFEIGLTYAGRVNVESLTVLPNMGPKSRYFDYADNVGMASGVHVARGFVSTLWTWGFILTDMFNALRVLCPGASANVIIRTLKPDYVTYEYYSAVMIWPDRDSYEFKAGKYQPFELKFDKQEIYIPTS